MNIWNKESTRWCYFYLAESTSLSLPPVDLAESTSLSLLPVVHRRRCPSFWGILDPVGAGLWHFCTGLGYQIEDGYTVGSHQGKECVCVCVCMLSRVHTRTYKFSSPATLHLGFLICTPECEDPERHEGSFASWFLWSLIPSANVAEKMAMWQDFCSFPMVFSYSFCLWHLILFATAGHISFALSRSHSFLFPQTRKEGPVILVIL